jgi:hypothetical protein
METGECSSKNEPSFNLHIVVGDWRYLEVKKRVFDLVVCSLDLDFL